MNIGYIGLGLMGKPCARNLMNAGYKLYLWARHPEKIRDLIAEGATLCKNPADVASQVEVLVTNLTDTADVREVLLGHNGVVEGGKPGLIVADMSTISALATRDMAEALSARQIFLCDTPVSGGTAGAQKATLTIMVGGSEQAFAKLQPVLAAMGSKVTRIGDVGAGQVAKSCNQIIVTINLLGVAEAFKLARSLDVDPAKVREALLGGFAKSTILEMHGQRMLTDDYAPGFKSRLHLKDMNIVSGLAHELGIGLEASELGLHLLQETVENGYAEQDSSAICKAVDKHN